MPDRPFEPTPASAIGRSTDAGRSAGTVIVTDSDAGIAGNQPAGVR